MTKRQRRKANLLDSVHADVRFALRSLARSPGWTAVALLTIALGVGATTTVFSVADSLLVNPVSYPGAARVLLVRHMVSFGPNISLGGPIDARAVRAWQGSARSFDGIEPFTFRDAQLGTKAEPEPIHTAAIDPTFLSFAGVRPLVGRSFSADDRAQNAPRVAMLAEPYWRRKFGAATDVLSKIITINGESVMIVAIAPATLALPDFDRAPPDIWLPFSSGEQRVSSVVVRIKPSVSRDAAAAELQAIVARAGLDESRPGMTATTRLVRPDETIAFRRPLLTLVGAVALLLLVACTNLAHLLLARGAARERELAVRFALGAGRWRLVRQLLTESLVLAVAGGVLAAAVGWIGLELVAALHPPKLVALAHVAPNRRVVALATVLTLATGAAAGLLVALRSVGSGIGAALRAGAAGSLRGGRRLRASLVVGEIALSGTLLVGALLLVHAVITLERTTLGFDARGLYGVTFSLRGTQFDSGGRRGAFIDALRAYRPRMGAIVGLTIASNIPPTGPYFLGALETPDHPGDPNAPVSMAANDVSPDFFSMMGLPLVAGRTFDATSLARNEVIVTERLARRLWPSVSPIGQRFRLAASSPTDTPDPWYTVVGVARDAVMHGLTGDREEPTIFTPLAGAEPNRATLIVRVRGGDAPAIVHQIAVSALPGGPSPTIVNVEQSLSDSIAEPRFSMAVLTTFAVLGVVLAAIGLYGVISYAVAQRRREIGIRMTLGATRAMIARLVVGDGLRLSLIGVALGLIGATAATRLLQVALYGVSRADPFAFAGGAAALIAISTIACIIPTLRATAIDPALTVRAE